MSAIDRRDFLKLVGAGTAGAGAGFLVKESSKRPREQYIPYVATPEDYTPGIASWYRTVCTQCPAGCGIEVRIREGRAKKIEGNPLHPVSQGHTCALGQSGLNDLYNPDRLREPQRRAGDRGDGATSPISWEAAFNTAAERLAALHRAGHGDRIALLTGPVRGHLHELLETFMAGLGSDRYLQYDFSLPETLFAANQHSFGRDELPYYDIHRADLLISFGADYLSGWISPVHHAHGYGQLRQGGPTRGHVVQIEPRMSVSGANADQWLPARPGSEGLIALALANEIGDRPDLAAYTLERAATASDLALRDLQGLAARLRSAARPLALAGGAAAHAANGCANAVAVNVLNAVSNAAVVANPDAAIGAGAGRRRATFAQLSQLVEDMASGQVKALLIHNCNPVYSLPESLGLRAAIDAVPHVIAISSYIDETSSMADYILTPHASLESWFDDTPQPGVGFATATLGQPVVAPVHDTLPFGDIIIELGRRIDNNLASQLPWDDTRAYIRERWQQLHEQRAGGLGGLSFDDFWDEVLKAGVWAEEMRGPDLELVGSVLDPGEVAKISGARRFYFQPFATTALRDGRGANLPWQQELPDPLTGIVYNSWVELNPATASTLGLDDGDVVEVSSSAGMLQAPVVTFPGIRPDVVAMPIGQGHTTFGRYASGRGANPLSIIEPQRDRDCGAHAWAATQVELKPTGRRVRLIRVSGKPRPLGRAILGPEGEGGAPVHHDDDADHHG